MGFDFRKPQVNEIKPDFTDLPRNLIEKIETAIGQKIKSGHIIYGGYSSAFSVIVTMNDSSRYFIKGSHPDEMTHGAKMLAQEIYVYETVDILKNISPIYIGQVELGGEDDWRLGIWHAIAGPGIKVKWGDAEYDAFADVFQKLYKNFDANQTEIQPASKTNFIKDIISGKNSWKKFNDFDERKDHFCAMFENPVAARQWLDSNLDHLITASRTGVDHFETLVHFDLRHDNILFDDHMRAYIIDWPNGCIGPAGYDLVCLSCDLMIHGNGDAWDIFDSLCGKLNLNIPQSDVIAMLAKISGYYALNAYRDVPEKLPRLRWLQKGFLFAMTEWLNHLKQSDSIPKFAN